MKRHWDGKATLLRFPTRSMNRLLLHHTSNIAVAYIPDLALLSRNCSFGFSATVRGLEDDTNGNDIIHMLELARSPWDLGSAA